MKKILRNFIYLLPFCLIAGCSSRSGTSVMENTKTASRYIGRGLKALVGGGQDSKLLHYPYEFQGPEDTAYIALSDEDGDSQEIKSFPLAEEEPGELGSFLPGIDGFREPVSKESNIFKHVHFDTNRDQMKSQEDVKILKSIAKYMKKNPGYYLYLEGHCDQRGTALYNQSLGSRRSNNVRNALIENGVDLNRLFTVSYGKEKPLDAANNPVAWEKNRRVQFKLFKKHP